MKPLPALLAPVALLAFAASTPARAAITVTESGPVAADPGQPKSVVLDDFNGVVYPGLTIDAYTLPTATTHCVPGAAGCTAQLATSVLDAAGTPAGTAAGQKFLAVGPGAGVGFTTIDFSALPIDSISFYWGSIDSWNVVQLLTPSGRQVMSGGVQDPNSFVMGATLIAGVCASTMACGTDEYYDKGGSQRVTFSWDRGVDPVAQIEFVDSPLPAFEVADVTGTLVPEPASALLLVPAGLALLARRRTRA